MARIVDKDTRMIDIDFGPVGTTCGRAALSLDPTSAVGSLNGMQQVIRYMEVGDALAGSFIQYQNIDLTFMTLNNEVMQPMDVSVQRPGPVPTGSNTNGNTFDQIEEYIYIFSRPLNNEFISNPLSFFTLDEMRELGLDRSQTVFDLGGDTAGLPTHEQTIYAEKRMYSYSSNIGASIANGELDPLGPDYFSIYGMPVLDSVTTWGTMSSITGPSLHCYRVVINRTQSLLDAAVLASAYAGGSALRFPPVNITFLCKDPDLTEGQYLTRLANAMNNIAEDGKVSEA